jgi:hypothetical protein
MVANILEIKDVIVEWKLVTDIGFIGLRRFKCAWSGAAFRAAS